MPIVTPWKMSDYGSTAGQQHELPDPPVLQHPSLHRAARAAQAAKNPRHPHLRVGPLQNARQHRPVAPSHRHRGHAGTVGGPICRRARVSTAIRNLRPMARSRRTAALRSDLDHRMAASRPNTNFTSNNSKERPYANIYPHLTTRSQTFFLHIVAESIERSFHQPGRYVRSVTGSHHGSRAAGQLSRTLARSRASRSLRSSRPTFTTEAMRRNSRGTCGWWTLSVNRECHPVSL